MTACGWRSHGATFSRVARGVSCDVWDCAHAPQPPQMLNVEPLFGNVPDCAFVLESVIGYEPAYAVYDAVKRRYV